MALLNTASEYKNTCDDNIKTKLSLDSEISQIKCNLFDYSFNADNICST